MAVGGGEEDFRRQTAGYVEGAAGAMAADSGEENFRRKTAGSGDISCYRGRGGRRSGNGKVDDGADEARGGDERMLVQRRG